MTFPSTIGGSHDPELDDVVIGAAIADCVSCGVAFSDDYDALAFEDYSGETVELTVPWSQICVRNFLVGRTGAGEWFCYRLVFAIDPQTFRVTSWTGTEGKGAGWPA